MSTINTAATGEFVGRHRGVENPRHNDGEVGPRLAWTSHTRSYMDSIICVPFLMAFFSLFRFLFSLFFRLVICFTYAKRGPFLYGVWLNV